MDSVVDDMLTDASRALDLSNIRFQLIRLEDTITFYLIERAQFPFNRPIYDAEALPVPCSNLLLPPQLSLVDYILSETERVHSSLRRYESIDEHPFFPQVLQRPLLKPLKYPQILHPNNVNINDMIKEKYVREILPEICSTYDRADRGEQQENYGSAATADVACLQALSRRIHYGKFVAESKFQSETEKFVQLIKSKDEAGIDRAITNEAVEQQVLERLRLKAKTYGTDPWFSTDKDVEKKRKIKAEAAVAMYRQVVIPLTKKVEVDYLMQRLKGTKWE